jgi:hypothetical protein
MVVLNDGLTRSVGQFGGKRERNIDLQSMSQDPPTGALTPSLYNLAGPCALRIELVYSASSGRERMNVLKACALYVIFFGREADMRKLATSLSLLALSGAALVASQHNAAAQSCFKRAGSGGTCTETLANCSNNGGVRATAAACKAAFSECMSSGRWIYRTKDGQCFDWGTRAKK